MFLQGVCTVSLRSYLDMWKLNVQSSLNFQCVHFEVVYVVKVNLLLTYRYILTQCLKWGQFFVWHLLRKFLDLTSIGAIFILRSQNRLHYAHKTVHYIKTLLLQWSKPYPELHYYAMSPIDKPWREISGSLRVYLILSCQHLLLDSFSVFQRRIKGLYILITRNWGSLYNVNATILKFTYYWMKRQQILCKIRFCEWSQSCSNKI